MMPFVKLFEMPCGRDAMQKNIIVLHNCPVFRDSRLPLALNRPFSLAGPMRAGHSASERWLCPSPSTVGLTFTPALIKG